MNKKEADRVWQKARTSEHITAYRKLKRPTKVAVAKAENGEMDALYEKLDTSQREKFAIRLSSAQLRASFSSEGCEEC